MLRWTSVFSGRELDPIFTKSKVLPLEREIMVVLIKKKMMISGFEITMKNYCDGDIFEHSFRL